MLHYKQAMLANQMPALHLQSGRAGLQRFILSKKVELCQWTYDLVCYWDFLSYLRTVKLFLIVFW